MILGQPQSGRRGGVAMLFHVWCKRPSAAFALGLLLAGAASPAAAQTLKARYGVSLLGLPLGVSNLSATVGGAAYSIEADTKLTGLAGAVTRSQGGAKASGALVGGRVIPSAYATTASNSETTRTVRMAMTGATVRGIDISPPFDIHPDRVPLSDQHKRDVVDPLSALVMTVPPGEPLVGPAACNRTLRVFDGHTRFDVKLAYVGKRNVTAEGYTGEVSVCNARYIPVAGHRANRPATKFMADNKHLETWLAPVGDSRVVAPFRIAVKTMIGTLVIEAEDFNVSSTTRASLAR